MFFRFVFLEEVPFANYDIAAEIVSSCDKVASTKLAELQDVRRGKPRKTKYYFMVEIEWDHSQASLKHEDDMANGVSFLTDAPLV